MGHTPTSIHVISQVGTYCSLKIELAVDMKSPCCAGKVERALKDIPGIRSVDVNPSRQTVLVKGSVVAESVKKIIEKETGMFTAVMGQGSAGSRRDITEKWDINKETKNLGSAIAAIAVGPSQVRGVVRMTQVNEKMCVIEGSVGGFSNTDNVCVSVHETGDLTQGCDGCGSPFRIDQAGTNHDGILSCVQPGNDGSAEFRFVTPKLTVADMIGRCVVLHDGSEKDVVENKSTRLACGIVARSSGLFQNTKRFCACDGVTIWEEKKRLQEMEEKVH